MAARFYFGAMSPYSWFAAERIGALLPDAVWCPVFNGGVLKAAGRQSWGFTDERDVNLAECERRAVAHGLGPVVWPRPWPTLDLTIARALAHAGAVGGQDAVRALGLASMRLAFLEGRDLGETDVVLTAAGRAGLDVDELAEAVTTQSVKDATRAAVDDARDRGVFGVPTVVVGEQLFWGDDRLDEAAAAARA